MWLAIVVSLAGAAVTGAGILAMRVAEAWAGALRGYFAAFAAGALVTVTFLHLMPEAFALSRHAPAAMLGGFGFMYALGRLVVGPVCGTPVREAEAAGLVGLVGLSFHSLIDGLIYSVSFSVSPMSGLLVAAGMIAHEFPEGIVTYALLRCSDVAAGRATLLSFMAVGLSTPFGTALSWLFVARVPREMLGLLLAAAAGALFHVGATHLLPQAERDRPWFGLIAMAAGLVVVLVTTLLDA